MSSSTATATPRPIDSLPAGLPIARQTLHDQVVTRLRDMVTEGRLAPGQRVNEVALCTGLGVSRTPLREALKTLAGEGLLELVPARGAIVRSFTDKDVADCMMVLKALEQLAGRLLCQVASDAAITGILALHAEMQARYVVRDRLPYFKLNQAIHSSIVAAADNAPLARAHEALQAQMKRIRFIGHEGPEKWAAAMDEHEEMAVALAQRDGEALAEVIGRHHDRGLARIRDVI
ncbi:GntR family transcriptional regulator [Roseomonas sp. 18066]|uniref:GntR family transcriptional regulator n=1 Tax=Roseomonas sp. 18066 TaxID=2681412 RepID=UPI00135705B4|nr:GntR family transcriptional regulator [Roseomonas sp. 18066]